jgi:magnesium transporter
VRAPERHVKSLTRLLLPDIKDMLEQGELRQLGEALSELHPADIADIVETLEGADRLRTLNALAEDIRAQVFENLQDPLRVELLEQLDPRGAAQLLGEMASDERTDVLKDMEEGERTELINLLEAPERKEAQQLLSYPEGSAGAVMTTESVRVGPDTTASETMARVRAVAGEVETISYIYVVDRAGRLRGVLSIRDLVLADPHCPVEKIMTHDPVSVTVTEDQEEVARKIANYDFVAIPVVDADGRMLGIITHDDVVDILREEQTEDIQKLGAMQPLEEPYLSTSFWALFSKRIPWLAILFFGEIFTYSVMAHYEGMLLEAKALILFVPLIISSGGNSGSQSATLIIRALATGEVQLAQWMQIAAREAVMGVSLGCALGVIGFGRALLFGQNAIWAIGSLAVWTAVTVGLAVVAVVVTGTVVGALLPMVFKRMRFDPAVTSNPFVASMCDVLGLVVYFNVARLFVSRL